MVEGLLALISLGCLGLLAIQPFKNPPPISLRYVALVGLLPVAVTAGLMAASRYDMRYAAASLLTFYTSAVAETTGALALAVALYSEVHRNSNISPQWYALPTGSSPLALISNYVPSSYIQLAIFTVLGAYLLSAARELPDKADSLRLSAFAFLGAAASRVVLDRFDFLLDAVNSNLLGVVGVQLSSYLVYEFMMVVAVFFLFLHLLKTYQGASIKLKGK